MDRPPHPYASFLADVEKPSRYTGARWWPAAAPPPPLPGPRPPFTAAFSGGGPGGARPPLCREWAAPRRAGVPRRERLIRLAERFPLYVPELYATSRDPET